MRDLKLFKRPIIKIKATYAHKARVGCFDFDYRTFKQFQGQPKVVFVNYRLYYLRNKKRVKTHRGDKQLEN